MWGICVCMCVGERSWGVIVNVCVCVCVSVLGHDVHVCLCVFGYDGCVYVCLVMVCVFVYVGA